MTTTAKALLNIMSVRLSMQKSELTHPHPSVVFATKQLVNRLQEMLPEEEIEIVYELKPFHAQYIWVRTGEVVAEIAVNEPDSI